MKNKFTFIGDEEDKRTKEWGIKRGKEYMVEFPALFSKKKMFNAFITTPKVGLVVCPYGSSKAFYKNWK